MNALSRREKTNLSNRQFSLSLYYPDLEEDEITITWDSAIAVDSITAPMDDSVSFACGHFSLECSRTETEISLTIRKAYEAYGIEPEQFEAFEDYRERVKRALSQYIKFHYQ